MHFLTFVLKNILRRRMRSTLTIIGIAVAVGAVVALVGVSVGFERSFLAIYRNQNVDLVVQQAGIKQRLTSALPESLGKKMAAIPGVKQVNPGLVDWVQIEELEPTGLLVQGWPLDSPLFRDLSLLQGRWLRQDEVRTALLGKSLAVTLQKKVGDTVTLPEEEEFHVTGIFESASIIENGMMLMSLEDLRKYSGRQKGMVNGFSICVSDRSPEGVEQVRQAIAGLAKNLDVATTDKFVNSTSEIRLIRAMAWITSTVALFIGAIGMLNTMIMSVFERTKEIGILRAIGWGRVRVMKMILCESLLLSVAGGIVGTIGAALLTWILSSLPAAAGVVDGLVAPQVIFQGFVIAVGVGILGAIYPAYRGAQLLPTEALRHE